MKYGQFIKNFAIPQWRECYINYKLLKMLIEIIEVYSDLKKKNSDTLTKQQIQMIAVAIVQTNKLFHTMHKEQLEVTFVFMQMKLIQLSNKFKKINQKDYQNGDQKILYQLENLYLEIFYLKNLYQINVEGERKILKKHLKKTKKASMPTPSNHSSKLIRLSPQIKLLTNDVEQMFIRKSNLSQKEARVKIRKLISKEDEDPVWSFMFGAGFGIGASLITIIVVSLYLKNINLQTDSQFKRDFPVWRGIAIFISYIWILAFNVYAFEKKYINHKLIFKFNDFHSSSSTKVFYRASIMTAVYLILLLFYVIQKAIGIYLTSFPTPYLALVIWAMLGIYIFTPLPIFNPQGRLYTFKLFFLAMIAPFYIVDFPIIWFTDQLVSLITPLKDLAYTVCYYTQLDLTTSPIGNSSYSNPCASSSQLSIIFLSGLIIYLYRMFQCIKLGINTNSYFFHPNFFNTLKYFASLMTLIFSFSYSSNPDLFVPWIIFAAISTIFSYYWDLKYDWGLLDTTSKNKYLRPILIYEKKSYYYFIIFINFFLRLSWVFTLSPNITASFNIQSYIFTLITGFLEILRRGIWNLLRVQKQHIANCMSFKAIQQEQQVHLIHKTIDIEEVTIESERSEKLKQNLTKRINSKRKLIGQIQDFIQKHQNQINSMDK